MCVCEKGVRRQLEDERDVVGDCGMKGLCVYFSEMV